MPLKNKAVFLLESQPPHLGELITVLNKIREYDPLYICVNKNVKVLPLQFAMTTWFFLMSHITGEKPTIFAADFKQFESISKLPDQPEFKDCTILTTNKEISIHLSSINVPVELVPHVLGYHSVFLRSAYRQGRALDYLLQGFMKRKEK